MKFKLNQFAIPLLTIFVVGSNSSLVAASGPGNFENAADLNRFKTVAYATQQYSIESNFNNLPSIKFLSDSYPRTVEITVKAYADNVTSTEIDPSSFTCNFWDNSGQVWTSTESTVNATITTGTRTSTSITCQITATRAFQGQFEVGSARTNGNYGLVRFWLPDPPGQIGGGGNSTQASAPTPAKYSGPEFSGLSGMGIMNGSTGKLEGKRLDEISSIEIGGKAATFTATSATELSLSLPAGLAPGLYDLVINSSAGKLTHINAIQVREPKRSFSITSRSNKKISEEQYLEHSIIASMQAPELNKARCVVNASSEAMAKAMATRLCALVKASNPNIETTVVVARSTVKNDTVFARVTYGWN